MKTKSVIQLKGVTKSFGPKIAVSELNLTIDQGEIYGFLGPNGSGKTTTIRLILDILRADTGEIRLFGEGDGSSADRRRRIGYLSGEMAMDRDLSGQQYLGFVGARYGGDWPARMVELAHQLDIDLGVKIGSYSRGNRQKIGLISALMHRSELLILDEPTSGFDPLVQESFVRLIKAYRDGGGTVFMSSHILNEVQQLCDRVAFIKDGRIVGVKSLSDLAISATKRVTVRAGAKVQAQIQTDAKRIDQLKPLSATRDELVYSYTGDIRDLLGFLATQPVSDVTIAEPELEEVFIDYYTGAQGEKR